MIPVRIQHELNSLKRREMLLRLGWGLARWLALVLGLLFLACLLDWWIDLHEDTPWSLRLGLFLVQAIAGIAAAGFFLVRPLFYQPKESELALWVEKKYPLLGHRLISAVQLNRPGAQTEGMSRELIDQVTWEAENLSQKVPFPRVANHRRLGWCAAAAVPPLLLLFLAGLLWPDVVPALLARQFLLDQEIPRTVYLAADTREVWPAGEKVPLRFRATGKNLAEADGEVLVESPDSDPQYYPLQLDKWIGPEEAVFISPIPPGSTDFTFRAWLGDGRTRRPGAIKFVPRPEVVALDAWTLLPTYCGQKPDGGRYEKPQARGDVVGIPDSAVRLVVRTQKPVKKVHVETLGPVYPEKKNKDAKIQAEVVWRKIPLVLNSDGNGATGTFDLRDKEVAYRILVVDEFGFGNIPPPRRSIRLTAEDPPQAALLNEQDLFPDRDRLLGVKEIEEEDLEGMPVPRGGPIRIGYSCSGAFGLAHARLLFRVLKKVESGNEIMEDNDQWMILPLVEVTAPEKGGAFNPDFGVFENSGPRDQVPFYAVPSPQPLLVLGRTLGGGCFNFQTTGIPDGKGGLLNLKEGARIEYCIEVTAGAPGAQRPPNRPAPIARTQTRIKTIVSVDEFVQWDRDRRQERDRIMQLKTKQEKLFSGN